ncbi:MAG: glycosyltransferase family 4 protein [Gammaproteobacteria bacterium]|nr:glycosyltransferase family 4 protein [Gammaproteobacteria bacterium]
MLKKNIVHLTSVHPRYDVRIFHKECCSLVKAGFSVSLVVADGKGDGVQNNVSVFDVGQPSGRFNRVFQITEQVYQKACEIDGDTYHLHDPELIHIGLKLKRLGKTVIFDAHEDVPKQLLGKHYLNKLVRWGLSKAFDIYESWACKHFDAIVTATPFIRDKFLLINPVTIDINNFPILGELVSVANNWNQKRNYVCYVGGIASIRGIRELVNAMEKVTGKARLQLCGEFSEKDVELEVKKYAGWEYVDELGWQGRQGVKNTLGMSKAGLVTLHPTINYIDALPVKMFEYMSAGIPVIASNFPLWSEIIESNKCGLCVDPLNTGEIAKAIIFLVSNPIQSEQMGENGKTAIQSRYNWGIEEKKLLDLYKSLI